MRFIYFSCSYIFVKLIIDRILDSSIPHNNKPIYEILNMEVTVLMMFNGVGVIFFWCGSIPTSLYRGVQNDFNDPSKWFMRTSEHY